ncbi:AAA family ATPase [Spirosoma sp. HMF4905]|uniref:AAA family ATPase n=1 Tax=Spirosoma arboris TaxID=2682092 RepID=A0A7K1SPF2_9BACT|nr:AAA family ATPase [Spirosoma arboris]MVM35685.1 AAA family ATPase [Spirosoma arboris]
MNVIIALSGQIGSGKTSISNGLAQLLNWDIVSFGNYIRKIALSKQIDITRENLQNLGESLVRENPESFCYSVLEQENNWKNKSFIIEGVRHEIVLDKLINIVVPSTLYHIHLLVSNIERERRVILRGNLSDDLKSMHMHPSEADVHQLLFDRANFIVDTTNLSVEETCSNIFSHLKANKIALL